MITFKILLSIAALYLIPWLILGSLFLGFPTIKRLKQHRDELTWFVLVPCYFALVVGVFADVLFNITWGTVIFREPPQEWLFTDRLKRHYWGSGSVTQQRRAEPWVNMVNLIDPGHV